MTTLCTRCGESLSVDDEFCYACGAMQGYVGNFQHTIHLDLKHIEDPTIDFKKINRQIHIKNSQRKAVVISSLISLFTALLVILTFIDGSYIYQIYALRFIGIFVLISGIIVSFVFNSRAKKLDKLINGENIVASWQLNEKQKEDFVSLLYQNEQAKNKSLFILTTVLIIVIFGAFALLMDEGGIAMFAIMIILIIFLAVFAFGMPAYYRVKNNKGEGLVLIGKNYAYLNGFFHNWDFPMSGIQKIKLIEKPFRGIYIQYYYYDRTLKHTEELTIPAPDYVDLAALVKTLRKS